jgi:hypothetical protein
LGGASVAPMRMGNAHTSELSNPQHKASTTPNSPGRCRELRLSLMAFPADSRARRAGTKDRPARGWSHRDSR